MNKRKVLIFSSIAVIALVGIIITQMLWMNDALVLRQEQFNQRVKVALKSVSTQILDNQIDSAEKYLLSPCDTDFFNTTEITDMIDAKLLDSLILLEFSSMIISEEFAYGVYSSRDSSFIMGPYMGLVDELINSRHKTSLSCIYKEEVYILGAY
ncbi:MAG: hypothetical protein ABFS05_13450, partial [Bacteroidota bacterium]